MRLRVSHKLSFMERSNGVDYAAETEYSGGVEIPCKKTVNLYFYLLVSCYLFSPVVGCGKKPDPLEPCSGSSYRYYYE